jgi:FkbM family methyltransferase
VTRHDGPSRARIVRGQLILGLERRLLRARLEREHSVQLAGRMRIRVRPGDAVGREIFLYGTAEYHLGGVLEALIAPGDTVVDIGANIGEHTLRAAWRTGPTGRVFAFEPQPTVYDTLARNIAANGFQDRVTAICAAVSDHAGDGELYLPEASDNSGLATLEALTPRIGAPAARTVVTRVPLVRLDDVLAEHGRPVSVVKVDVEGHELAALAGAAQTISASRPAILFEVDADASTWWAPDSVATSLRDRDYAILGIFADGERRHLAELGDHVDPDRLRERWKGPRYAINLVALDRHDPRLRRLVAGGTPT